MGARKLLENHSFPRDLQDALTLYAQRADDITKKFFETIESKGSPETIFHYTNDDGLRGILDTGCLWLSDMFTLNDPSELNHSFSHAIKILKSKAEGGPPEMQDFASRFENAYKE